MGPGHLGPGRQTQRPSSLSEPLAVVRVVTFRDIVVALDHCLRDTPTGEVDWSLSDRELASSSDYSETDVDKIVNNDVSNRAHGML